MAQAKTILVTGGAGYLGSQFIRDLATSETYRQATIRIYDNLLHKRYDGLLNLPEGPTYNFIEGDILDRVNLSRAMMDCDEVVHLAALVTSPFRFRHDEWMQQVNCHGTSAVVETAIDMEVPRLVAASTSAVYGTGGPFTEDDIPRPFSPYAVSMNKAEKEIVAGMKRGLKATTLRFGSIFGHAPGMGFDDVISKLSHLAGTRRSLIIHGNGEQVRPFVHIQDAAAMIRFCLENSDLPEVVYNGVTLNASVRQIVDTLQRLVPDVDVRYTEQDFLNRMSFDVSGERLQQAGFKAEFDLEKGLKDLLFHWRNFSAL